MFWIALLGAWLVVSPLLGWVIGSAIAYANDVAPRPCGTDKVADAPIRTEIEHEARLATVA